MRQHARGEGEEGERAGHFDEACVEWVDVGQHLCNERVREARRVDRVVQIEHTVEFERRRLTATVVARPFFDPERKRSTPGLAKQGPATSGAPKDSAR